MIRFMSDVLVWFLHVACAMLISTILVSAVTGHGRLLPAPGGTQFQP